MTAPNPDPPTVRNMRLPRPPRPPERSSTPNRDLLSAALRDAHPARRWAAQRLVAAFATYQPDELEHAGPGRRWRADRAIRAAERLLDVPPGTVRAATTELRTERIP